jgi:hypothetical protein
MASDAVSPLNITRDEFDEVLARYGPLIEFISSSKGSYPLLCPSCLVLIREL